MELDRRSQVLDRISRSPGEALAARDVVQEPGVVRIGRNQLRAAVSHLGVRAGVVERPKLLPCLVALDVRREDDP